MGMNASESARNRSEQSMLFRAPELLAVQKEYMRLAANLWAGSEPQDAKAMKDRDIFEFLGFE